MAKYVKKSKRKMRQTPAFILVSILIGFCFVWLHLAAGQEKNKGVPSVKDEGSPTCTVSTSTDEQQDQTVITQTITCDDGTKQICVTVITSNSTTRTCTDSSARNQPPRWTNQNANRNIYAMHKDADWPLIIGNALYASLWACPTARYPTHSF